MSKIIFLDVDGTLINYQTICPPSAFTAVDKARENGHKIYLCTGCSKAELAERILPDTDGLIGANGGYVESAGKVIMHNRLSVEQVKHVVDWCNQRRLGFYLESNSGRYCNSFLLEQGPSALSKYVSGKGASDEEAHRKGNEFISKYTCLPDWQLYRDDVNKISFVLSSYQDHLDSITEFPDMAANTWGGKDEMALFGDLSPAGINKKAAIEILLKHLGADKKDTISFGDARIDLTMFESCSYNVAMGNGSDEIKKAADYITDDVNSDGLYKAFKYLELI